MQILFFAEKGLDKIRDVCGIGGNALGKQTYVIRNAASVDGSNVTYFAISGTNESLNLARSQLKEIAAELQDPKRSDVIIKINQENAKEKGTKLPTTSLVFSVEEKNLEKVRDLAGVGANSLERQSVIVKSAEALGETKKGNYILIEGSDDATMLARELLLGLANEVTGPDRDSVIKKIKSEEETAGEGFGSIFG